LLARRLFLEDCEVKTVFLNWRGPCGRETVDAFTPGEDAPRDRKAFRAYVSEMQAEYALAGMPAYQSSRPCAGWNREA
jgi:hypothetical protein